MLHVKRSSIPWTISTSNQTHQESEMKRLILDANVLVRFLVQDDPKQAAAAAKLMKDAEDGVYELKLDLHVE